jgi:hypothetical protein
MSDGILDWGSVMPDDGFDYQCPLRKTLLAAADEENKLEDRREWPKT